MEKRIIAVVCILLLLVSILAACGKKTTMEIDGVEYAIVTDDEGNTVVNDAGDIVVYVTDANGEYMTDANGEKQTNVVDFPDKVIGDMTVETSDYKFTMPLKGWSMSSRGLFIQDNTDDCVLLSVKSLGKMADGQTLDTIAERDKSDNEANMEEIKKTYPDSSINVSDVQITDRNVTAKVVEFVVKDNDGNMVYYAHGTYYIADGQLFKVEFICNDGKYYDPELDLIAVINEGLTIKNANA